MSFFDDKDVEIIVSRAVGLDVRILKHRLEPFSDSIDGTMGCHYKLSVDVIDDSKTTTHTFFVKAYSETSAMGDQELEKYAFEEEVNFFEKVQPIMLENYKAERWSSKCFLVKPTVLVFEDLRAEGYVMAADFMLDEKTLRSVIVPLARFHACSLLAEAKLGKTLKEAFPSRFEEKLFNRKFKYWKQSEVGLETCMQMARKLGLDPTELPKIFDHACEMLGRRDGDVNVINHGDLWKNNMMCNDALSPKCILIDYQLLRYTSFACDLNVLLHLCMAPEFRKESEIEMFKLYYSVFQETLQHSGMDIQIPTYDKMFKEYEEHRIVGKWYVSMYAPGLCFSSEELLAALTDPEMMNEWLYGDRFELFRPHLDSNTEYAALMKELMIELFDEAKRFIV